MYGKVTQIPAYQSDEPISCDTKSVVFPIRIFAQSRSYISAVGEVQRAVHKLEEAMHAPQGANYNVEFARLDDNNQKHQVRFKLLSVGDDLYGIEALHYLFVSFRLESTLFERLESVATVADQLLRFIAGCEGDDALRFEAVSDSLTTLSTTT